MTAGNVLVLQGAQANGIEVYDHSAEVELIPQSVASPRRCPASTAKLRDSDPRVGGRSQAESSANGALALNRWARIKFHDRPFC